MCRWFRQQGNLQSVLRDVHNFGSIPTHTFLCQFVHVRFSQKGEPSGLQINLEATASDTVPKDVFLTVHHELTIY